MVQTPLDQERARIMQRPAIAMQNSGAAAGGLQAPQGAASSPMGQPQQPSGAAPPSQPTPEFQEALTAAFDILLRADNPADFDLLGQMLGQLQAMYEDRMGQGQGAPQQGPMAPGAVPSTP